MRALIAGAVLLGGCRSLPEPDSPGAKAYEASCGTATDCHRAYMPGTMTWPMWNYQLGRMKEMFAKKGRAWLTPEEERLVKDYLQRHAEGEEQ